MAQTTAQFVSDLVDALAAHGVTFTDTAGLKTSLTSEMTDWLGGSESVPAGLVNQVASALNDFHAEIIHRYDFWFGSATGGPLSDGYYDFTLTDGTTVSNPCLAKILGSLEKGDPGGIGFTFKTTTTDADPGSGCLWLNSATPASVTFLYVDNNEIGGASVTGWLDSFDDAGSSNRGQIQLREVGSAKFMVFRVSGAVVDGTGYRKVPVAFLAGSALFTADAQIVAIFSSVGSGDVVGPTGATDGHAALFDGSTGKLLKDAGFAPENAGNKGNANGYAGLDSGGKVPVAQLPASVLGGLNYQGTWNATTNSPTIPAAASGNKGWFYKVATAGTTTVDGISDWQVGDWIVSNGATWDKVDNTDQVTSVIGLGGAISQASLKTALGLVKGDVGLGNVDNTSDANKPVSTATQAALDLKITGPAGATDGHVIVFDGSTGKLAKDGGFAPENAASKGVAGGYAGLDGSGKVPTAQLPASVLGGLNYQGTWNATTNSPTIPAAASGNKGWFYKVATAGTTTVDGISEWAVGDWIVSNGATWDKVDNTDSVTSVAGLQGIITAGGLKSALSLTKSDVGLGNVDNTSDANKPISTATQAALDALSVDYLAAVGTILALTPFEVTTADYLITDADNGRLLFFTGATRNIAYVESLSANVYCGVMMASAATVEVRPGASDIQAPSSLLEMTTEWKFGVIRRLTSALAVFHGGEATLPALGIDRLQFDQADASGLALLTFA